MYYIFLVILFTKNQKDRFSSVEELQIFRQEAFEQYLNVTEISGFNILF